MPPKRANGSVRADLIKNSSIRDLRELFNALLQNQNARGLLDSGGSEPDSLDESLDKYTFQQLKKPRSIRLLKLRMGGKKSKEIECELYEEDLGSKPKYEALSWSWGGDSWDRSIRILRDGTAYRFEVPRTLISALRALRYKKKNRILWIDAICIDQQNTDEKNKQVPMMSDIYGQATGVCVWIGEENVHSKIALDFIKDEVLRLQEFDELCEDEDASPKWRAMLDLMKSSWFSRRWGTFASVNVVQEIALANEATIYCGDQTISWKDFSDAVQLFVEVESATHRLSEVMRKDPQFYHVPGWFEYVSALGASLLVNATGTLFRKAKDQSREPLLSLEYLVSSMTVFEATVAHDTIYSLLAIAKDTEPIPVVREESQASELLPAQKHLKAWGSRHAVRKPYRVDYQQPLIDVCQEFIAFCIQQSEPTRALDIICRPWAPVLNTERQKELEKKKQKGHKEPRHHQVNEEFSEMPSWIPTLAGAAHAIHPHATGELRMGRQNADPLVGLPDYTQRNYSAAGTTKIDELGLRFKKYKDYYTMSVSGFICDRVERVWQRSQSGNIPKEWIKEGRWNDFSEDPPDELWRTLVADRGRLGRNPPTYYARACKESINKGLLSGSLNTSELIEHGRCSVVAEFFRRVQAVIWNRSLMRTENDALGIVNENARKGDLVCVLYGCSVPVILRRHAKNDNDMEEESREYERDIEDATVKLQRIYRDRRNTRRDIEAKRIESLRSRTSTGKSNEAFSDTNRRRTTPQRSVSAIVASKTSNSSLEDIRYPLRSDKEPSSSLRDVCELSHSTESALNDVRETTKTRTALEAGGWSEQATSAEQEVEQTAPEKSAAEAPNGSSDITIVGDDRDSVDNARPTKNNHDDQPRGTTQKEKSRAERRKFWYEFIGESYVHGMMDGEAIKYQNENLVPAQMFELR